MLEGGAQIVDEEADARGAVHGARDAAIRFSSCKASCAAWRASPSASSRPRCSTPTLLEAVASGWRRNSKRRSRSRARRNAARPFTRCRTRPWPSWPRAFPSAKRNSNEACEKVIRERVRRVIIEQDKRIDDRRSTEIRPISAQVQMLPRTHGSALFTRGETQALATATLGTSSDEQKIDALIGERYKKFMLHYNFPPFCTGEVKFLRGPGRREIGHGALAERALLAGAAARRGFSLHHPRRLRGAGVQRQLLDGHGVRRQPRPDGRRRADQGGRSRASRWAWSRKASTSACSPTSWATRTIWATWTSRSPAPPTASPPSRWTTRSAA